MLFQLAQAASYRAVAAAGDGEAIEADGWLLYDSGTGIDVLNEATVADRSLRPDLEAPLRWFASRGTGYRLFLCDPDDSAVIALATTAGYTVERSQPVMARNLPLAGWEIPAGLRVEHVQHGRTAWRYLAVRQQRPAHHPALPVEARFIERLVATGSFAYLVALRGETPIATASAFCDGRVTIVSNVFVREAERRNGLGAAMTAAASRAFPRAEMCALEASSMGEYLYRRMGFETLHRRVRLRPPQD
jgi:hypothetical protein